MNNSEPKGEGVELERCVHCGSIADLFTVKHYKGEPQYFIRCSNSDCPIETRQWYGKRNLIVRWNTRHQPLEPMYYPPMEMVAEVARSAEYIKTKLKLERCLAFIRKVSGADTYSRRVAQLAVDEARELLKVLTEGDDEPCMSASWWQPLSEPPEVSDE